MGLLSPRRVGVDIGATAVRVVEVSGVDAEGFAIIRRVGIQPLPEGVVVAGDIKHPVPVGQAISLALKQARLPKSGFVLGVGSRTTALGRVSAPDSVTPEERSALIRNSKAEISPTSPLRESAISWNLVRSDAVRGIEGSAARVQHTLNVGVAKRDQIDTLVAVCKLAGAQPLAVDLTGAALLRAMTRIHPDDGSVSTIVDVGASRITVATREGSHLRSVRTFAGGGIGITRTLMNGLGLDLAEAEDRKRYLRISAAPRRRDVEAAASAYSDDELPNEGPPTSADDILTKACEPIIDEIAKSIELDARTYRGTHTQGIQLVGGGARIRGFAEYLQARTGVPTATALQWADLQYNRATSHLFTTVEGKAVADPDTVKDLTVAVGLALWKAPA